MAAVTSLGSLFDTNSGTHTVTATPAVGDLIVILVANGGSTGHTAPTDNNSSGTYVSAGFAVRAVSADTLEVWVRTAPIKSAVSTIFTHAAGTTTGGGLNVLKVTGMSTTGAAAVRQVATQSNIAVGNTPTVTFGVAVLTNDPLVGLVMGGVNPENVTAPTSYTRVVNAGWATPTTGVDTYSRDSGETNTTITWGSTNASAQHGTVLVELSPGVFIYAAIYLAPDQFPQDEPPDFEQNHTTTLDVTAQTLPVAAAFPAELFASVLFEPHGPDLWPEDVADASDDSTTFPTAAFLGTVAEPIETFAAQPPLEPHGNELWPEQLADTELETNTDVAPLLFNDGPLAADEVQAAQPLLEPHASDLWPEVLADTELANDTALDTSFLFVPPLAPDAAFGAQQLLEPHGNDLWPEQLADTELANDTTLEIAPQLFNDGPLAADEVQAAQSLFEPHWLEDEALYYTDQPQDDSWIGVLFPPAVTEPVETFAAQPLFTENLEWAAWEVEPNDDQADDVAPLLINDGPLAPDEVQAAQALVEPHDFDTLSPVDWFDQPQDDTWIAVFNAPVVSEPIETFAAQPTFSENLDWYPDPEATDEPLDDVAPYLVNDGPLAPDELHAAQAPPTDFDYETAAAGEFFDNPPDDSWLVSFAIDTETLSAAQPLPEAVDHHEPEVWEFTPLDEAWLSTLGVAPIELFAAQGLPETPVEALWATESDEWAILATLDAPALYGPPPDISGAPIAKFQGTYYRTLVLQGRT